jgi:hypothetical protein
MFGLEKQPNNKKLFEFDLEKEMQDPKNKKKVEKEIADKILDLKNILRQGVSDDETFEEYGSLLRGYAALQKVINRVGM